MEPVLTHPHAPGEDLPETPGRQPYQGSITPQGDPKPDEPLAGQRQKLPADSGGWFKLHRRLFNHWTFTKKRRWNEAEAWIYLIGMANHSRQRIYWAGGVLDVKRGQHVTSQAKLAEKFSWTRNRVRRFLDVLKTEQMIEHVSDAKKTTITICNYDIYQGAVNGDQAASEAGNDALTEQQSSTPRSTNKNERRKEGEVLPKKPKPIFDPTGKTKHLDNVYLSETQLSKVISYYQRKGLGDEDLKEAIRSLDAWYSDNPRMRLKRLDDAKALIGWPLDRVLERKAKEAKLQTQRTYADNAELSVFQGK